MRFLKFWKIAEVVYQIGKIIYKQLKPKEIKKKLKEERAD